MTNEDAFNNWLKDNYPDYPPFPQDVWQAAISYMQEQNKSAEQSEPVAWMCQHEETGNIAIVDQWQIDNGFEDLNPRLKVITPLFTLPQRVEASSTGVATRQLKRLSGGEIEAVIEDIWDDYPYDDCFKFANAIMDEMERLNK